MFYFVSKLPLKVKKNIKSWCILSYTLCTNTLCFLSDLFSSSTFKDPERASLRDSGHGDSDQADSDQDTNKGSCCDMSAKEALKLKATGVKPPPLEQGESCTHLNQLTINSFSVLRLFLIRDLPEWIWTWLLYSPLLCSLHFYLVWVWGCEQMCILYTSSVYQSRQAHYVFISPTTSDSPFSPPFLSTISETLIMEHGKWLSERQAM